MWGVLPPEKEKPDITVALLRESTFEDSVGCKALFHRPLPRDKLGILRTQLELHCESQFVTFAK